MTHFYIHILLQMSLTELPKFQPLGTEAIRWTALFYNPKHSGDRRRLERLEEQVRIVMRLLTKVRDDFKWGRCQHECFERPDTISFLSKQLKLLINTYREEVEDEDLNLKIAKMVTKKRFVLHVLFYLLDNEKVLAQEYTEDLKKLEEVVLDDITDWMEIVDYIETVKNPSYLH